MSEMIYGIHAVQALLERDPQRFLEVFVMKGREDRRLMPLIAELEQMGHCDSSCKPSVAG
ncbi:23S rRNA (guanosine-2'-O-)-methyltransferase RlmB [Hafnia alvei]|uniref:23S rRNA (Guanosine-2'-O-)-methyltransferase RlmB n=1 Tax=Hafnia alvei TaxID=569 RepID=A0A377PGP4_HAFAL|nr:23S rRNA (guanosine-2'-O-)-methyltransferase RlmB [Hafnia alvei]